ncbi:MAG: hypothetical protein ABJP82_07445 [Hyphomicrobiales bacterium]
MHVAFQLTLIAKPHGLPVGGWIVNPRQKSEEYTYYELVPTIILPGAPMISMG